MPNERRQFHILYRDFLFRMVDLELLPASGDIQKLLGHLVALLAALSLAITVMVVPRFALSTESASSLAAGAGIQVEFMIATTMTITGLLMLLAWNSILPDRRDCIVLGLLPVRRRTIFAAKVAAIGTALGICIVATNLFTGISLPFVALRSGDGWLGAVRALFAYWTSVMAAGLFVCAVLLAVQGMAAQLLSHQRFQRLSSAVQFSGFFLAVVIYFFKPPAEAGTIGWIPSFWFFGLFRQINGSAESALDPLGMRALLGLLVAVALAAGTFALAFSRVLRHVVEQPDIAPGDRSRAGTRVGMFLARHLLADPLDRAIVLFVTRTIARSRQHRLLLAAYGGVGLATALVYIKDLLRGAYTATLWEFVGQQTNIVRWNEPSIPLLAASLILLVFVITGVRAIFPLPLALPSNWIFRITAIHHSDTYFGAVRRSLYALAAIPVWTVAAIVFLTLWPIGPALQHIAVLTLVGILLVENSLYRFEKIPFTCSYLPGKSNLNVKLGLYALIFLLLADRGVAIELWALGDVARYGVLVAILGALAFRARRRASDFAENVSTGVQFEDSAPPMIASLDLSKGSSAPAPLGLRGTLEDEMDEELQFHLRMAAADRNAQGESHMEARYNALRELGNLTRIKEDIRAVWNENSFELLLQDLRFAVRGLTKTPVFTVAAVALIALGIGLNGSVFSLFHGIMQRPMPQVNAHNLVSLGVAIDGHETDPGNSWTNYLSYVESTKSFRRLIARGFERFTLGMEGSSVAVRGGLVTADYFDTLGVRLPMGRAFTSAEGALDASGLVAVISDRLWTDQFERSANAVGRTIVLNGHPATIVGVAPPRFRGIQLGERADVWVPMLSYTRLQGRERQLNDRAYRSVELAGQLADGVTLRQAQAELDVISKRLEEKFPTENRRFRALVAPHTAIGPGDQPVRVVLKLLLVVGGLLLMVVCANVANLVLSRSLVRRHEMAVRKSLGAPLSRLVGFLLAEALMISVAGAAAGWAIATWVTPLIVGLIPDPPLLDLSPDRAVLLYAFAQAMVATIVFATFPAFSIWRQDPLASLKSRESGSSRAGKRVLTAMTVVQLTASVVLLIGAGLLLRSSAALDNFDAGFQKDGLLFVTVNTGGAAKTPSANAKVLNELVASLEAVPGVASVSYAAYAPLSSGTMPFGLVSGDTGAPAVRADYNAVGPDYLTVLGARLRAGRDINAADRASSRRVAVINENLARALWPGRNPLGREVVSESERFEVVGVVSNGAYSDIRQGSKANMLFVPFDQYPEGAGPIALHIRPSATRQILLPSLRTAVFHANPRIPIMSTVLATRRMQETTPLEFLSTLITVFGVGALLVAGVGLYGLVALNMARRTREFAVRIALGATSGRIWREALRDGLTVTVVGLATGLLVSAVASRALRSILFGVSATDGITYAGVAAILGITCIVACLLPARRATRTDPARVLREE